MKKYVIVMITITAIAFAKATIKTSNTTDKEKLGEALFFDPILSKDSTVSVPAATGLNMHLPIPHP